MNLSILFWIYKDVDICVNRAKLLRAKNKGVRIYCLFGGDLEKADEFQSGLSGLVDDFYAFPENWTSHERWLHGDRMLADWYRQRGRELEWDSIFIAQWDMVLLQSVRKICGSLKAGQLLLPGLRPVREVESFWWWLRTGSQDRVDYEEFRALLTARGIFPDDPLCCNFIAAAFPRAFLDYYTAEAPDEGFLEYKIPVMAQVGNFDFCLDHKIDIRWLHEQRVSRLERYLLTLHAEKDPVRSNVLAIHRCLPWGRRVFHPYVKAVRI